METKNDEPEIPEPCVFYVCCLICMNIVNTATVNNLGDVAHISYRQTGGY